MGLFHEQMKVPEAIWAEEMDKFPALGPAIMAGR
jgi:hypothetical protein